MNNEVFNGLPEEIVQSGITISQEVGIIKSNDFANNGKISAIGVYEPPKKKFTSRESALTVLLENLQIKTVFHFFLIFFLNLACVNVARDIFEERENPWYGLIRDGFGKFHIAIGSWFLYYGLTCVTYFCFKIWATIRTEIIPMKSTFKKFLDTTAILILLGYYIFSFQLGEYIMKTFHLPPASALTLLIEQTRMLMKVHAFVRSNVPKVLKYGMELAKMALPSFKYFIFFTFLPTLIYKDEYPRTPKIRWKTVAIKIIEIFSIIISLAFLTHSLIIPKYRDFGLRKYTYKELIFKILDISFPSLLFFFMTFYLVLHQVQNLFAEILRFGDRMFYREWWTACDFTTYCKTWNVIVYDWLFFYIYRDCCTVFSSKIFAKYLTFFVSALVHEWIMMHALGFFFPIMFCLFFFSGTFLSFIKIPQHYLPNIIWLSCISYGTSLIISCYTMELIARINDIPPLIERLDFFIPRSLTCAVIYNLNVINLK